MKNVIDMAQRILLSMLLLLIPLLACSAQFKPNDVVELDDNYRLQVVVDSDHVVSVSLYYRGTEPENLVERYAYSNGTVLEGDIRSLELDDSNDGPEFLVIVNDRTSNYGARVGLIFWKRGGWRSVKIPHEKFAIRDDGGKNLIEINGTSYRFMDGYFVGVA